MQIKPLTILEPRRFETVIILKQLASASRKLAELKGIAASIPHEGILINCLGMQEAKDSSAIENIITTHDELFEEDVLPNNLVNPSTKEVARYRRALSVGSDLVRTSRLLTSNTILRIQAELEKNTAGFRKVPGTALKDGNGNVVYTPPQDHKEILSAMGDLEQFINRPELFAADPLIKMALIHHQFESIHPFYDGNGRTGRIINVLYLVKEQLLDSPVIYISRYIVNHKADYYRLLQEVREQDKWEEWVLYMLKAVEQTSEEAITTITAIRTALMDAKHRIRDRYKFYSQDLINNLFTHPYTKIEFLQRDLGVSRLTATKYLDTLAADGFLEKRKSGRAYFYINTPLANVIVQRDEGEALAPERVRTLTLDSKP